MPSLRAPVRSPLAVHVFRVLVVLSVLTAGCASDPPARPQASPDTAPADRAPEPAPVEPPPPDPPSAEEERVLATVDRFFIALADKDKETFSALLMPEGVRFTQIVRPEGTELRIRTHHEVLERFGEGPRVVERYWNPTVMIRGPIAIFWAPYVTWADGKENHRGVDSFQLLLVDGEWRIATATWTSEPGAPESFRPPDESALRPAITP